jgi:hypothetical protein
MLPQAASEFYALQQRVNTTAAREVARAWRRMGDDFDGSWRRHGSAVLSVLVEAQTQVTDEALRYVPRVLSETGLRDEPTGTLNGSALVGIASDGRPLDSLAYGAVTTAKVAVSEGASTRQALAQGGNWLDLMAKLQIADAARQAVGVLTASRKNLGGTVRVLNPPSCQRCADPRRPVLPLVDRLPAPPALRLRQPAFRQRPMGQGRGLPNRPEGRLPRWRDPGPDRRTEVGDRQRCRHHPGRQRHPRHVYDRHRAGPVRPPAAHGEQVRAHTSRRRSCRTTRPPRLLASQRSQPEVHRPPDPRGHLPAGQRRPRRGDPPSAALRLPHLDFPPAQGRTGDHHSATEQRMTEAAPQRPRRSPAQEQPTVPRPTAAPTVEDLQAQIEELTKNSRKWKDRAKANGKTATAASSRLRRGGQMSESERPSRRPSSPHGLSRSHRLRQAPGAHRVRQPRRSAQPGLRHRLRALEYVDLTKFLDESGEPDEKLPLRQPSPDWSPSPRVDFRASTAAAARRPSRRTSTKSYVGPQAGRNRSTSWHGWPRCTSIDDLGGHSCRTTTSSRAPPRRR